MELAIAALRGRIDGLDGYLSVLAQRLDPVLLQPRPCDPCGTVGGGQELSEIPSEIMGIAEAVRLHAGRVEDILERLDL